MILIDPFPGVVMPPSVELRPRLEVLDSMGNLLETPSRSAFRYSSSDASVATVSEDGVIRVRGLATPGARTDIRITYGEAETFLMVSAAEQPVAAKVTPEYTLTPGAQVLLYGVAVNPQGVDEASHVTPSPCWKATASRGCTAPDALRRTANAPAPCRTWCGSSPTRPARWWCRPRWMGSPPRGRSLSGPSSSAP